MTSPTPDQLARAEKVAKEILRIADSYFLAREIKHFIATALADEAEAVRREAGKDTERLDWLDANRKTICYREVEPFIGPVYETTVTPIRAAIDAAMRPTGDMK